MLGSERLTAVFTPAVSASSRPVIAQDLRRGRVAATVRQIADDLKRSGFPAYASDLETQLQAALATLPRLQLTWADNSTNEESFIVERKTGQAGTYRHLATLPPNTTTYVDMSVEEGVTYCYRVRAVNAARTAAAKLPEGRWWWD